MGNPLKNDLSASRMFDVLIEAEASHHMNPGKTRRSYLVANRNRHVGAVRKTIDKILRKCPTEALCDEFFTYFLKEYGVD